MMIGMLAYCFTQRSLGTNLTASCKEIRSVFKAGPAIYETELAKQDVNRLKVRNHQPFTHLVLGKLLTLLSATSNMVTLKN